MSPLSIKKTAYKQWESTETAMHHVITHIQEPDNMEVSLELSSILRELLIAFHVTLQGLSHGMAWRHSLVMSWLHAGWLKFTATLRGDTLEWPVAKGCPKRGILLSHSCEAWL